MPGEDARRLTRYVRRIAKLTGAEVAVTDDADSRKEATDSAGLDHQISQKHVVPNVLTILASIAEQREAAAAKNVSGPGGLTIDKTFNDVATLEEIILARAGVAWPSCWSS